MDHVHILFGLGRTQSIAKIVERLKVSTSIWIKTKDGNWADFHWQSGYGVFGISPKEIDMTTAYIRNQKEHHREISFQEEFRVLLEEFELDYDERYVWD